jgi:hypothetical protein
MKYGKIRRRYIWYLKARLKRAVSYIESGDKEAYHMGVLKLKTDIENLQAWLDDKEEWKEQPKDEK